MVAPDAPFPTTAAASPGDFKAAFEAELGGGADAVVCVTVGSKLSATFKSAEIAAQGLPGAEIHVVDSDSASMGTGILALLAAEMADAGVPAAEIAAELRARVRDIDLYVALDTIEYLRKGGRISPARAAIATVLSIKPIITVTDGLVETADRVRTRAKARERVIELLTARPVEWIAILHTPTARRRRLPRRGPGAPARRRRPGPRHDRGRRRVGRAAHRAAAASAASCSCGADRRARPACGALRGADRRAPPWPAA